MFGWLESIYGEKLNKLLDEHKYVIYVRKNILFGLIKGKYFATNELNEKAYQVAGFKRFLKAIDNMKDEIDIKMWEDYLIYAQVFGMAEEVVKKLNTIYPDVVTYDICNDVELIKHFSDQFYIIIQ